MGAMAFLELMIDELNEPKQELSRSELIKNAASMEEQLERMNRIIRGVLDLERLRELTELRDICDANLIVEQALRELEFQLADANVELEKDLQVKLPPFWGNRGQFTRAIVNLIENSLKFSIDEKKHIIIRTSCADQKLRFEIGDNGVGIPPEHQERVFDRFFRAEQTGVAHVTGSGLGLNLVKSIVDHHSGNIWLKSEVGVGTTFYIEVPTVDEIRENFA
jgi:two-component system sensor histidine kinase NblS